MDNNTLGSIYLAEQSKLLKDKGRTAANMAYADVISYAIATWNFATTENIAEAMDKLIEKAQRCKEFYE